MVMYDDYSKGDKADRWKNYTKSCKRDKKYYTDSINYVEQTVEGECSFPKINGRVLDMTVEIKDGDYDEFKINFAKNDKFSSSIIYDKSKNEIEINRLYSGMNRDTIGTRKVKVRYPKQSLKLRVIFDKYSVEIFVMMVRKC